MSDGDTISEYHSMSDDDSASDEDTTSDCDTSSDDGIMSEDDMSDSPPSVFGPDASDTEVMNPLGKETRVRIDIDGCTGLPPMQSWEDKDHRRSWYLEFRYISRRDDNAHTRSSEVYEGKGMYRGTVLWNEALYIDSFELSHVLISLRQTHDDFHARSGACVPISDLLQKAEIILWPRESEQSAIRSTLHFSASRSLDDRDKVTSKSDTAEPIQRNDRHNDPPNLWNTIFSQFSPFTQTVLSNMPSEVSIDAMMRDVYWLHWYTFQSFKECQKKKSHDPKIGKLLTDMGATVNVVRQSPYMLAQHGRNVVKDIIRQIYWLSCLMSYLAMEYDISVPVRWYQEAELARLILIIGIPDPALGASSISASTSWHIISGTITKDALLLALEAIVQSADAFPPLKSAASGLLFFATCADTASNNKKQIRDIYRRVESLAASLKRGAQDGDPITPMHQEAIAALANDITILNEDLQDIINERKSRFKRFFSAKRHREELKDVVNQLESAKSNYTAALATLNATTNARVLAHVRALTLVMGVSPVEIFGTRRADAVEFPSALPRIEEV